MNDKPITITAPLRLWKMLSNMLAGQDFLINHNILVLPCDANDVEELDVLNTEIDKAVEAAEQQEASS